MIDFIKRFSGMPKYSDRVIHIAVMFLAIFGLGMITSATMGKYGAGFLYIAVTFIEHAVFLVGGYLLMTISANLFRFQLFEQSSKYSAQRIRMLLFIILIGMLLIPLFFDPQGGAYAWISIPIPFLNRVVSIQPSEFAKVIVIAYVAYALGDYKQRDGEKNYFRTMILVGVLVGIILFLQRDLGSAFVLAVIAAVVSLVPYNSQYYKWQRRILIIGVIGVVGMFFLMSDIGYNLLTSVDGGYRLARFTSAKNPFADISGDGYQLVQGLIAFASGGFSGLGFTDSVQKYVNFPAAETDYILAIIGEELGVIGVALVFIAYITIIFMLFRHAFRMPNEKSKMVLVGTAMYLFLHFFLNVGGVTGMIPLTGVPLLMLSSGGSSTVAFMFAIGISQAVIHQRGEYINQPQE